MTSYFSTFISGLQEVVKEGLVRQSGSVEIDLILDGLVTFRSEHPLQTIKGIRFLNNTFLLLHVFKLNINELERQPLEFMMNAILRNPKLILGVPRWATKGAANFRIIASRENQTESIDRSLLEKLERFFSYRLALKINRSKPDVEVWFISRSEGYGFAGIRLTRTPNYEKTLQKGELRPELANLLCFISEPDKEDIVLDPFAGSGAIPMERAAAFPYKKIIASELDKAVFRSLQKKIAHSGLNITLARWDALNLSSIAAGSITKIITDPPWGIFSQLVSDLEVFYTEMLREFSRILKNAGVISILMGQKELFEKILIQFPELTLVAKYDILVSGKKAAVYKIRNEKITGRTA